MSIKKAIADIFDSVSIYPDSKTLPKNMSWPELVCDGHIWIARVNNMIKLRNIAILAFVATLSYDLIVNIPVMNHLVNRASNIESTFVERWFLSPVASAKQAFSSEAPTLHFKGQLIGRNDDIESATNIYDLPDFISKNLATLNSNNRLAYACDKNWNITQVWSHEARFDVPKCKIDSTGVWIGSLVSMGSGARNKQAMFGVFRKVDGEYKFWNVLLPNNAFHMYSIQGHPTVRSEDIPRAVAKAFPVLVKGVK